MGHGQKEDGTPALVSQAGCVPGVQPYEDRQQKKPSAVQKKIEEAFCMTKSEAYRCFKTRQMKLEESPNAYIADLQRLAGDASPEKDENHSVVEQFLDGLPHQ